MQESGATAKLDLRDEEQGWEGHVLEGGGHERGRALEEALEVAVACFHC